MITVSNNENSASYSALFTEAFAYLADNVDNISNEAQKGAAKNFINERTSQAEAAGNTPQFTSVQEYFSHLKDLLDAGGKKFLMLPLDEPVFEIDANKREITVPSVFKKNGISVQGDEIAESLIFRINRFFDYADLNEMVVKVQWQTPDGREGISDIYVVDNERSVDYLYLMWPLTEQITRVPGTVKFSVRFYNMAEGGTLMYSFATKVASATINAGHNFAMTGRDGDKTYDFDSSDAQFANAITNSRLVAEEDAPAPRFLLDLVDKFANGISEDNIEENWDYKSEDGKTIEAYINENGNAVQVLRVEATGSGMIGYDWIYVDTLQPDANTLIGGKLYHLTPVIDYRETADTDGPVEGKKYYVQVSEDEYVEQDYATAPGTLYEKFSIVQVENGQKDVNNNVLPHVVGKYYAIASNYVGSNHSDAPSKTIVFPAPEVVEFDENGGLAPNAYMQDGVGKIVVQAKLGERGTEYTYNWLYSATAEGPFTPITDQSLDASIRQKLSTNEAGNELTIRNQPGYFKVQITGTRNYEPKTIESESSCKVAPIVVGPTVSPAAGQSIAKNTYYNIGTQGENIGARLQVIVEGFNSEFDSEKMTYQWYRFDAGNETGMPITSAQGSGELTRAGGTITYNAEVQDTAAYYCEITNIVGDPANGGMAVVTRSATFVLSPWPDVTPQEDPTPSQNPVTINNVTKIAAENLPEGMGSNQNKVTISKEGNVYTITGNLAELDTWTSTNSSQAALGDQPWIALDIDTNLSTINGATWDGQPLGAQDVEEAQSVGLGEGHIVFWARANALAEQDREITIGAGSRPSVTITVKFTEG